MPNILDNVTPELHTAVLKLYDTDTGHCPDHVMRVGRFALEIVRGIGGLNARRRHLLAISVLMHDMGRAQEAAGGICHAEYGAEKCKSFLQARGYSKEDISEISQNISDHRYSKGKVPMFLSGKILQDADRLDALGLSGFLRCVRYCQNMGWPLYDESYKIQSYKAGRPTTLHGHWEEKISKIKPETFYSEPAKAIAEERYSLFDNMVTVLKTEHINSI